MLDINSINLIAPAGMKAISSLTNTKEAQWKKQLNAKKAVEVAKGFESVLLNQVMEGMERTIPKSDLFTDKTGEQIRSMFWQFMSEGMVDQGGIGLWKQVYKDIQHNTKTDLPDVSQMEHLR